MKEVVVLSGKGGTGKTSIVSSFAALSKNTVIADCDVDAADLHLLLNPKQERNEPFFGSKIAEIVPNRCNGCGICEAFCRFEAISEEIDTSTELFKVNPISCEGCGVCVSVCPEKAILFEYHENGRLFVSSTKYGPMVHAQLGIAEENSGRLVSLVRERAKIIAEENNCDIIIIDGSPGIGCPVISAITGTQAVLIITEPSISGVHDMERVVNLISYFNIPVYICINKYDINIELTEQIIKKAKKLNSTVLGKIHYDSIMTKAQINAMPIVEYIQNGISKEITDVWNALYENVFVNGDNRIYD